jgi:predicted phosphodiesterase
MRYAILSDIHGNLEAFKAVLDALSDEMIESYLSVGDVVGYGADPKECIRLLRSLNPQVLIAGNHEWGILGLKELDYFNELAQKVISWTKAILDKDELDYLKSFSLVYNDERMSLVHGTLNDPEEFYYIFDPDDADATMNKMSGSICFVGHSHVPGIFASNHTKIESFDSRKIRVDYERKYIINVGSIGQPRDGDPRASYAIYDDEEALLEIKRVEYDVKKTQAKILKAGLPARLADRLSEGR